jgi:Domain of unknown function (DUF3331)
MAYTACHSPEFAGVPSHPPTVESNVASSVERDTSSAVIWDFTLHLLERMADALASVGESPHDELATTRKITRRSRKGGLTAARLANVDVTLVERLSPSCISVCWLDSTASNYREQRWTRRMSSTQGICALSGCHISSGEYVYGPTCKVSCIPENRYAMILARVVED